MPDQDMSLGDAVNTVKAFARTFQAVLKLDQAAGVIVAAHAELPKLEKEHAERHAILDELAKAREKIEQDIGELIRQRKEAEASVQTIKSAARAEQQQAKATLEQIRRDIEAANQEYKDAVSANLKGLNSVKAELDRAQKDLATFHEQLAALHA